MLLLPSWRKWAYRWAYSMALGKSVSLQIGESGPPNTLCDCLHEYTHKHMRGKHHDNIRYKTDGITGVIGLNWTDMDRILVLCKKVKLVIII